MEENKQHKTALPETEPIPSAQAPEALLDIRGLRVEYHTDEDVVYAVNGLDLTIGKGESLGLVGETGAGKTTTALSVLRLIADPPGKIMGGEIWFEGEDMLQAKPARLREIRGSKISVIFQDPMTSLNPVYSVGDQIAEVFDHPHQPYTIGLFGSIPSLEDTAEKHQPIQGQMPDPTELPEGCAFAPRCPYATGACRTRKPEMTGVGGTQMVRCLAHQGVFESPELMEEVRHGR